MHPLHDISSGPNPPERIHVYIEIPRGERNKYEIDKETGALRFDRLLYSAVHYPGDYGFVPRTLAQDGDALDVLVLITAPTFPGCLMEVRPLGMFQMRDEKGVDEKILAVSVSDPYMEGYEDLLAGGRTGRPRTAPSRPPCGDTRGGKRAKRPTGKPGTRSTPDGPRRGDPPCPRPFPSGVSVCSRRSSG